MEIGPFYETGNTKMHSILCISPYVKIKALDYIVSKFPNLKSLVTTWKINDLLMGMSDLDVYLYCKEHGIKLFINQDVHLKAITDLNEIYFGSANITLRGLGLIEEKNLELVGGPFSIDFETKCYLQKILQDSVLVDDELYNTYKSNMNKIEPPRLIQGLEPKLKNSQKDFLISTLPMSGNLEVLYKVYNNHLDTISEEDVHCAVHDIVLYSVPKNLSRSDFNLHLEKSFFETSFVKKLLQFIDHNENGQYFGRVKEWIQANCSDVPVPSRRDLTGNIQVLYMWIKELSNGLYEVDRPNYSERIFRTK